MKKRIDRRLLILICLDLALIAAVLIICFFQRDRVEKMYSELAAERWQDEDMAYSEVSVMYSRDAGVSADNITAVRNSLMKTLFDDSYIDVDEGRYGRAWFDTYSGQLDLEIRTERRSLSGVVYAVGDDFFMMHPIPLKGGGYLNPVEDKTSSDTETDGTDHFQIVLDENMAWNLFGSSDVAGMKVWIGDKVFTVMGVVEAAHGRTEEAAYGNFDAAYIPYSAVSLMNMVECPVTCYQAVLPNPIKRYAYNAVAEAVGIHELTDAEKAEQRSPLSFEDTEIVENTGRFDVFPLISYLRNKKYSSMRTDSVIYPYWENVARYEVDRAARILILCTILLILPVATLIGILYSLWRRRGVVFNRRNRDKLFSLAGEVFEGMKLHFKHPDSEDLDDDPLDMPEDEAELSGSTEETEFVAEGGSPDEAETVEDDSPEEGETEEYDGSEEPDTSNELVGSDISDEKVEDSSSDENEESDVSEAETSDDKIENLRDMMRINQGK